MPTMIAQLNGPRDPKSKFGMQATATYLARIFKGDWQRVAGYDEHGKVVTLTPEQRAAGEDYHDLEFAIVTPLGLGSPQDAMGWLGRANPDANALKGFRIVSVS